MVVSGEPNNGCNVGCNRNLLPGPALDWWQDLGLSLESNGTWLQLWGDLNHQMIHLKHHNCPYPICSGLNKAQLYIIYVLSDSMHTMTISSQAIMLLSCTIYSSCCWYHDHWRVTCHIATLPYWARPPCAELCSDRGVGAKSGGTIGTTWSESCITNTIYNKYYG